MEYFLQFFLVFSLFYIVKGMGFHEWVSTT